MAIEAFDRVISDECLQPIALAPLPRGEGEQSQRFVPDPFVERHSRDLIEFIPCPIR